MSDVVYVALKIGNQLTTPGMENASYRDGDPVCYIDEDQWGLPFDAIVGADCRKTFGWLKVPKAALPFIKNALQESGDPVATAVKDFRVRKQRAVLDTIQTASKISDLVVKWRSADIVNPVDCTKLDVSSFFGDATKILYVPDVADLNVITSGTCTVGAAGTYATWTLFGADIGNLTGNLTATQISVTTEVALITMTETIGAGNTLTFQGASHGGDPTKGYITSIAHNSSNFDARFSGPGNVNFTDIYTKRTVAGAVLGRNQIGTGTNGTNLTYNINRCLMDGNDLLGTGFYTWDKENIIKMSNCLIWGMNGGDAYFVADASNNANSVCENSVFYLCNRGLFIQTAANDCGVFRNVLSSCTTCFSNTGATDGYNNASAGLSAADGNWATGSGNKTNIVIANEVVSTVDTNAQFLQTKEGGVCWDGGVVPTLASSAVDIRGRTRALPYEIGASRTLPTPSSGANQSRISIPVGISF